jgi:hypothetical protein
MSTGGSTPLVSDCAPSPRVGMIPTGGAGSFSAGVFKAVAAD